MAFSHLRVHLKILPHEECTCRGCEDPDGPVYLVRRSLDRPRPHGPTCLGRGRPEPWPHILARFPNCSLFKDGRPRGYQTRLAFRSTGREGSVTYTPAGSSRFLQFLRDFCSKPLFCTHFAVFRSFTNIRLVFNRQSMRTSIRWVDPHTSGQVPCRPVDARLAPDERRMPSLSAQAGLLRLP